MFTLDDTHPPLHTKRQNERGLNEEVKIIIQNKKKINK